MSDEQLKTLGWEVVKIPTKEEREQDRQWLTVNYSVGAAVRDLIERYIAALEHVEAELAAKTEVALSVGNDLFVYGSAAATEKCQGDLMAGEALSQQIDTAVKFKTFVHAYLDQHGVPHGDPENEHQKEGCRIGARLDLLFAERDQAIQIANDVVGDAKMLYHSADLAEGKEGAGEAALRLLRRENGELREENARLKAEASGNTPHIQDGNDEFAPCPNCGVLSNSVHHSNCDRS